MKTVKELTDVPFPACATECKALKLFGASECDSICPNKFIKPERRCMEYGVVIPERRVKLGE